MGNNYVYKFDYCGFFMGFKEEVFRVVRKIPRGKVSTYAEIARALGGKGYRAVGNALNKSPGMPLVPCHRVIRSDGRIGGFAFGGKKKIEMLRKERIEVIEGGVDLTKYFYRLKN